MGCTVGIGVVGPDHHVEMVGAGVLIGPENRVVVVVPRGPRIVELVRRLVGVICPVGHRTHGFLGGGENLHTVVVSRGGNTVQLFGELLEFLAHVRAFGCGVRVVAGFHDQFPHPVQDRGLFIQGAVGHIQHGDGILRILHGLRQPPHLGPEVFRHAQSGRVVGSRIDSQTGRQFLHGLAHGAVHPVQGTTRHH